MSPYIDELESELRAAHERRVAVGHPSRQGRHMLVPGALGLVLAILAVVLLLDARTPAPAKASIPVLRRPAVDVSTMRAKLGMQSSSKLDLQHARRVDTPNGAGYVIPSSDGARLCLTIPDPVDGFGQTCAATAEVARRGLVGSMVGNEDQSPTVTVAVLPNDSRAPKVHERGGGSRALMPTGGVIALTTRGPATLTFKVPGSAPVEHRLLGPLVATKNLFNCAGSRYVEVPKAYTGNPAALCRHALDGGPPRIVTHK